MSNDKGIAKNRFLVWLMWSPAFFCCGWSIFIGWTLAQYFIYLDQMKRFKINKKEDDERKKKELKEYQEFRRQQNIMNKKMEEEEKKKREKDEEIKKKNEHYFKCLVRFMGFVFPVIRDLYYEKGYTTHEEIVKKLNIKKSVYIDIIKTCNKYFNYYFINKRPNKEEKEKYNLENNKFIIIGNVPLCTWKNPEYDEFDSVKNKLNSILTDKEKLNEWRFTEDESK